jgi:hypothetical protein
VADHMSRGLRDVNTLHFRLAASLICSAGIGRTVSTGFGWNWHFG